jgi:hypothetical protein
VALGSGGLRRVQFGDPVFEALRVLRVEVVRCAVDDLQHAPIAGDSVPVFAPLVVNVAEELPSVGDIRMAFQDMAGGGLEFFQVASSTKRRAASTVSSRSLRSAEAAKSAAIASRSLRSS